MSKPTKAGLDESEIRGISGHSMRVGAAQDILNSGASMPIIMQRGRWSKIDTVLRYLEHGGCTNQNLIFHNYMPNPTMSLPIKCK